jgi:hypothetical protein
MDLELTIYGHIHALCEAHEPPNTILCHILTNQLILEVSQILLMGNRGVRAVPSVEVPLRSKGLAIHEELGVSGRGDISLRKTVVYNDSTHFVNTLCFSVGKIVLFNQHLSLL